MLTFQDGDLNTALHFGARNGCAKICAHIIKQAERVQLIALLVNCRNNKGFTPLIEVSFRGFKMKSEKDSAIESRYLIVKELLRAGANAAYCKPNTQMTALHWLAYNNDSRAIDVLLQYEANHLAYTHDNLLPIDIAGTVPSYAAMDAFLSHYSYLNNLHKPREFHNTFDVIDKIMA